MEIYTFSFSTQSSIFIIMFMFIKKHVENLLRTQVQAVELQNFSDLKGINRAVTN